MKYVLKDFFIIYFVWCIFFTMALIPMCCSSYHEFLWFESNLTSYYCQKLLTVVDPNQDRRKCLLTLLLNFIPCYLDTLVEQWIKVGIPRHDKILSFEQWHHTNFKMGTSGESRNIGGKESWIQTGIAPVWRGYLCTGGEDDWGKGVMRRHCLGKMPACPLLLNGASDFEWEMLCSCKVLFNLCCAFVLSARVWWSSTCVCLG